MLITFFQCCESISLTPSYYLSLSFALVCGGNEASEMKKKRSCSDFGDLYTQAGFPDMWCGPCPGVWRK